MRGIHATLIVVEMIVKNGLKSENPKLEICVWIFFGMWKFMSGSRLWKVGAKELHLDYGEPQCGVSSWMIGLKWEDFC